MAQLDITGGNHAKKYYQKLKGLKKHE